MGYDAACTLTIDDRSFRGTAVLEQKELLFRGDVRLAIPLAGIVEATAQDGRLVVDFGGRRATLELGAQAAKWAQRITSPPSRADKLGVKPAMRVALVGIADETLVEDIQAKGATLDASARSKGLNLIFFAASARRDLDRLAAIAARLDPAGAIWLIRAKGKGAPVSERESMAAGKQAGLVDVKVVSYSDTHSAEKYVIPLARRGAAARPAAPANRGARQGSTRAAK
jgi:hypothetical protein